MMAIESSIMDKLPKPMNEWATYKPNDLVANAIGDHITGMGFYYSGSISETGSTEVGIPVMLNVDLNGDDVDATMSENVIYCFINADKIDYFTKVMDPNAYSIENLSEVLKNLHFVPKNQKAWRDATKLYLLKINLNSGLIGRYDTNTGSFKNQEVNWNSSTPEEVAELLLTKEYMEDYLRSELSSLESYVDFYQPTEGEN